jgi:hypothetical protein
VKHLDAIRRNAERTAKRLNLKIEQVAGFADGTYRVEYKENEAVKQIGFKAEEPKK